MAISFACTNCGKWFDLPDENGGKRGRCKQCGHVFRIPLSSTGVAPTGHPSSRPATTLEQPGTNKPRANPQQSARVIDDPYGLSDVAAAPPKQMDQLEEVFVLPARAGFRPVSNSSGDAQRRKRSREDGTGIPNWLPLTCLGILALALFWCWIDSSASLAFTVIIVLMSLVLMLVGSAMYLGVVFRESVLCFILHFVPFYGLYYALTRWSETKRALLTSFLGWFCMVAWSLMVPALMAGRAASVSAEVGSGQKLAEELLAQAPATGPGQIMEEHEKIVRALIAETNETADVFTKIRDQADALNSESDLHHLADLNRRLHERRAQIPQLDAAGRSQLNSKYGGALATATNRVVREGKRVFAIQGVRDTLTSILPPGRAQPMRATAPALPEKALSQPGSEPGLPQGIDPAPPVVSAPPQVVPPHLGQPPAVGGPPRMDPPGRAGETFRVLVHGIPDDLTAQAVSKRLAEIHARLSGTGVSLPSSQGRGLTRSFEIGPKVNLDAFAASVDFGRARKVSDTLVDIRFTRLPPGVMIDAQAEMPPPPQIRQDAGTVPQAVAAEAKLSANTLVVLPRIGGQPNDQFYDFAPPGSILVGVRVSYVNSFGGWKIGSVQPLYRSGENVTPGRRFGDQTGEQIEALAKPGYGVGQIRLHAGLLVDGFDLVFMKVDGDRLNANDSYASPWLGDPNGGGPRDGNGQGLIGIGFAGRVTPREVNEAAVIFVNR